MKKIQKANIIIILYFSAGVTIMALGAMAKYPGLDVKIVPCGTCCAQTN